MRYKYIKGTVQEREEWVFKLFDYTAQSQKGWLERTQWQAVYDELKLNMTGSYINEPTHKYHHYVKELINRRLIKKELLDYVLVSNISRRYFEQIMGRSDMGITLGVAFPWLYPGTEKKTGAEAVHQIFVWDLMDWLEKTSKWYYKLFFWKRDFEPLHPEITMKGLIYHELIHARQYIVDGKREPPRDKNGNRNYKNYLEVEAYSHQFLFEDTLLGEPYYLNKWKAKTYEQAAKNYLDYLTGNEA